MARAAGTGLKATLTIGSDTKDSATYAITAGDAVLANSTITRDSDSYVSGKDIQVTVVLKDGNTPTANPVTGLSSDTLAGMVAVANADAKSEANWVESSTKGTYVGTYVAKAAGTGLKATLKIGSATKDSATYAITAGDAVLANSSITRDSDSYVSGSDITVTVTLKDGNTPTANPVTGLSSDTLAGMVAVANTDAKSEANWVESSTKGTYVGTYVAKAAGTGLKATLKIGSASTATKTYSIVAGGSALANSSITRDSDSYVSGKDIQVTVVLKDDNTPTANPVTGLSSDTLSGMVAVANADAKSKANWVESATKGTYVGTYVARAAGTGLKATLTIGSGTKDSATYAITAGDAVLANSSITRDSDSYVSGSDITVTVTLKDGNTTPNPVTGLSSDTLSGMVAVANADAKSKANWVESATKGTYEGTFVARAAGAGLKATLKIGSGTKDSATYAITAGDAVLANSSITRDSANYVSGTDIQVTVVLKDGNSTPNPVTGLSSDTLAGMVTVANADAKSKANWVESATKGTYVGTFVACAAGAGLKATLKIGSGTKDSATYAITAGDAVLANSSITRDSDSYVSGSDITVTVTLKDGNTTPNPVTGLSSDTLSGMVTVANADAKSKANWVESSTKGTYVGTYVAKTAGTGLKATLKVSDGSKTSDDYVITAGDVVLANSTIARDSDSYVSGTDIKVTVVLKDGNTPTPNPVTGLSSDKLTAMVAVANADAKSNTNWVESATKGTYVGTYVARAAGTGLKATLTIGAEAKTSENYVITAGDAVLANSSITRDSDSYVSGSDMKVTVTLKDGNTTPNPVTGLSSDTLSGMVTVANADAKSKANWVESATKGTYEGTFVARAAGTGLKATLTIGSGTKDSATYAITAGDAVLANSSITRDSDSYVSGTDIKVTVVLKDGNTPTPNPVTGLSSDKLAAMVAVANADAKSNTNWVESSTKGTYEGIYVAKKAGTGLKATLTISNNTLDADLYNIVADAATAQVDTVILEDSDVSKVADSKNTFTYTVTVKDSNGNLVSGVTVAPKVDKAGATATVSGVTGVTGETKITLTGSMTVVSDITVSAQVGTTASKNADKTVSFTYGEVATISLATTDGKTTAVVSTQPAQTLTLTVEDEYGRKIPNQTINLAISGGSGGKPSIYPSSVTSDAVSGEIADKALLADTTAETVTVTASLSGSNVKGTLLINFVPDVISTNTSTITADPARIVADGQSTSKVVYVPKDRYGNVITDITPSTISSTIIGMSNTEFTLSGWTYANKQYTAVVTAGTTTGGFRVIPVIDGNDGVSRSGGNILTLVAGDIDITQSSIKAVPATIIADGKSTSTLQFVPKDKFGNIIDSLNASSISQVLTGDATDMKVGAWTYSSNSQWYTAMLTAGTMSGAANIMPTVNGENAAQNGVTNTLTLAYSSSVKDIVATSVGTAIADGAQTNQVTVTIYGANNQIISGATVNITPSSKELLINGQNAVYTGTTDAKGQVTVSMASTFIGENQFTVESDRYSEVSDTSFGIYVSPVLSSVGFDKTDLFNNGTDKMTVTFYPVDAKGRAVEGLDVEFTSTDAGATLTSSGYATVVTTKGNPTTYFLSVVIKNYSLWKPDDSQYNVIPESGVKLATISVQPKLCALDTPNLPGNAKFTHCSPSDSVNYYHSGLGFVVKKIDANPQWKDQKLTLQSSTIDGELLLTSPTGNSQNCSVPVSDSASWMNDFGDKDNIFPMDFNNVSIIDTYQTPGFVGPAFSGGGVGSCEVGTWNNPDKLNVNLSGRGNVLFTIRTSNPDSITPLKVPLTSSRVDAGLIGSPISVNIYSVN
ncbi:invasin domain 3-containing protein [Hafnia paralvei]|uniref:invasin domain 3-containing protein n=2 Tax=Hafnia paralvei TaxID=546367 RepID=UPI001CB8AF72|nr:invasin domain 3-containing protein [Hafnia paralvei]